MSYQLARLGAEHPFLADSPAAQRAFRDAVDDLLLARAPDYRRLWAYYRNPMHVAPPPVGTEPTGSDRPYRHAQEWGIPSRLTGYAAGAEPFRDAPTDTARKEIVVENDIGWRIDTLVDFLFGRPFTLDSAVSDRARADEITALLRRMIDLHGGLAFLQRMSLVGAVYGSVDVLVKFDADARADAAGSPSIDALARRVRFEIVEPSRALPLLSPTNVSDVRGYAQAYQIPRLPTDATPHPTHDFADTGRADWLKRLLFPSRGLFTRQQPITVVELITPLAWQIYRDERLTDSGENPLGQIPLVHVQNIARPFEYEGGSDVEPLLGLQDELNTRLSDRANRVALQSMKMYLGVGIDGFGEEPIQPGRMWSSDNLDARVHEFGGDAAAPSEEAAIRDVREAMDKASGVNPVAAGAVRNRIGHLTSAAALRVTFQSLLARTERKRANYGAAIERMCELALGWLDVAGLFRTTPEERGVRLTWPDPIPAGLTEQLEQARLKQLLGIDPDVVRRELGY